MKKEDLEAVVAKALEEHPEIFPSGPQIAELLKQYGFTYSPSWAGSKFDLSQLQKRWLESCEDEVFLENFNKHRFNVFNKNIQELVDAKFREIVKRKLEENPDVFPGGRQISTLLQDKIKTGKTTIQRKIDIAALQSDWIEKCSDEIFLENFSAGRFVNCSEEIKNAIDKRIKKIITEKLEKYQELFPGSTQIMDMLMEEYGIRLSHRTVLRLTNLTPIQMKWIKECDTRIFLENLSGKRFTQMEEKGRFEVKKRLIKIINGLLREYPIAFPTSMKIAELIKHTYGVEISYAAISENIDLPNLQEKWVKDCSDEVFLNRLSDWSYGGLDKNIRTAVKERFEKLVEKLLDENPEIFPGSHQIPQLLKRCGLESASAQLCKNLDLPILQEKWVRNCNDSVFLENLIKGRFSSASKKVKNASKEKFRKIVTDALDSNPSTFPSTTRIATLLKKQYEIKITANCVGKNIHLINLQLAWVDGCSEEIFLKNLSKTTFTNWRINKRLESPVNKRMHGILLSHIENLDGLPISKKTLENYLKKFPDLAFLLSTEEHRFTLDQRTVLAMHVWKETRSADLHKLIEERLEQLWGFRELFALMKDGRCLDADIISMFHESLPERIRNYISESAVTHSFVDNLRSGDFKAGKGKDVLLLSFMHWLTDKQSAEIMLRLNQSVGTGNAIYMTSPNGLEYADNLIASMNTFGFVPEKVGSLYLLPPSESGEDEQRKLLTKGKVLQFRKMQDVDRTPEELQLFSNEKKKKGGVRPQPKADIISYDEKTLKKSLPLITMKDVGVIFTEEIPEVRKVEVEGDRAILTLKGGAVLGFNVEPEHPYSIEIEGKKIPKGTDNAILDVTNGKEGFELGKGLKKKYNEFMKLIRDKRKQIGPVKKKILKR